MREKRASPRVDFQGRTVVYLGDQQVVAKGSNLSATGILLLAPLAVPLGKTLKLALSLRPSQWVNVEARVVRQTEGATVAWGLEFMRLSRDVAAVLAAYVTERLGLTAGDTTDEPSPREASAPGSPPRSVTGPERPAVHGTPPRREDPAPAPPRPKRPTGGFLSTLTSRIRSAWNGEDPNAESAAEGSRGTSYALGGRRDAPPAGRTPTGLSRAVVPESPARQPAPREKSAPTEMRAPAEKTAPREKSAPAEKRAPREKSAPAEKRAPREKSAPREVSSPRDSAPRLGRVLTPTGMEIEDVMPEDTANKLVGTDRGLHGLFQEALDNMDTEAPNASRLKVIRKPNLRR